MRSIVRPLLFALLALAAAGDEPVDLGKVLRESKEFKAQCARYRIEFSEGLVSAVGEIVYRGGGPCEYLVSVFPTKGHETIVLLDDGPPPPDRRRPRRYVEGLATNLNNAFLAAGFKPGTPLDWDPETGEVFPPKGETVHIYAEWKDGEEPLLHVDKRARFITNMGFANFSTVAVDTADARIKSSCMIILEETDPGTFDRGAPTHKIGRAHV